MLQRVLESCLIGHKWHSDVQSGIKIPGWFSAILLMPI